MKAFWGLDAKLANKRHYPSINYLTSYSLYIDNLKDYMNKVDPEFRTNREKALALLQEEAKLEEIVNLVGLDSLSPKERLTMEIARHIREDFLQQNAFDPEDAFTSIKKQFHILNSILLLNKLTEPLVSGDDFDFNKFLGLKCRQKIIRAHFIPEAKLADFEKLNKEIADEVGSLK